MIIDDKVQWTNAQHQKQWGSWAALHGPFTCRCGAEDHVEAVKKLQNSTKLLQKVVIPWRVERVGSAWNRSGSRPLRATSCVVCPRGRVGRMKWREGGAVLLSFLPVYSALASISEQPESAERPGCAHCPQPQEQPRLGTCGHVTQVRDKARA